MNIFENEFSDIRISRDQQHYHADVFSGCAGKKQIILEEKSTFTYLLLGGPESTVDLEIHTQGPNVTLHIYALLWGTASVSSTFHVNAHLLHDHGHADVHIISLLPEGSSIYVDGTITIHADISKCAGHLLEENILLGKQVQINTLPMLDVRSNDVSASHGARIESLDAKKLFYTQSRGLTPAQAKGLIVQGYMQQCFGPFEHSQGAHIQQLTDRKDHIYATVLS